MHKTVEGRWGPVTFFLKDEYVGRSIYSYGEYNPDETEMILSLADKEKYTLDIGANIGCIAQALEHEGHKVVAFEPQPAIYEVLKQNFKGAAYNVGLGDERGVGKMPKVYYSDKGNFGGLGIGFASVRGTIDVQVGIFDQDYTLDRPVGLVKLDVEGFELKVLKGCVEMIKRDKPILYVEDDRNEKSTALREFIVSLGYTIEEHKPTLYREKNFFECKKNIWEPNNFASHNIICRPC